MVYQATLRDILVLTFCALIHFIYRYRRKPRLPLPPGIPPWPVVGNALSMPLAYAHAFYKDLGGKLGTKIMYLSAFGRHVIVLNDIRMAQDLLEQRSGLYSSRPEFVMIAEVIGIKTFLGLMVYGDEWRGQRRLFHQHFSPKSMGEIQERELEFVRKSLLPNISQSGSDIREHLRNCIGGLSTSLTYGLPTKRNNDPLVQFSEEVFGAVAGAAAPGKYLVNIIAPLKYIPAWVPGAGFQTAARHIREEVLRLVEEPYKATLEHMDRGTCRESFVSGSLERYRDQPDFEIQARWAKEAATQIFGAASETTLAATMTFVLAMLLYPDIQRQAQKEVDAVVGPDRLPDFSDRSQLPFLSAIIKEVLRWNPIVPIGVPHLTTEEDVYEGYYIPKNCTIIANTHAMLQDEELFPSPKEFNPYRFFKNGLPVNDLPDPEIIATFGFGRRICPGSQVALSMLYICAVSILSLFDISPMLEGSGNPINVTPKFTGESIVSDPLPFPCNLTPRKGRNVDRLLSEYLDVDVI